MSPNEGDNMLENPSVNEGAAAEEEEDVIDIDNPDELAAKGLKRIQIEGEDEEYLMDMEGNIYDLRGNFIGTTDGDNMAGASNAGESQMMGDGMGMDGEEGMEDQEYVEEYWIHKLPKRSPI